MLHTYTEDQFVKQLTIKLFATYGCCLIQNYPTACWTIWLEHNCEQFAIGLTRGLAGTGTLQRSLRGKISVTINTRANKRI